MRIKAPPRKRPAMSMTPLIDVVFLLLLFFMLASTFAHFASVDVSLAREGQGAGATAAPSRTFLLSVRDGAFFALDGVPMALAELPARLREAGAAGEARVVVRASADARAQDVLSAVSAARQAEIGPVYLVH